MASVTQTAITSSTSDSSTPTFTAQAVGANGGADTIYLLVGTRTVTGSQISSATVDGVSATLVQVASIDEGGGIRSNAAIFAIARNSIPDPTQTDVDIAVTTTATCIRYACAVAVSADSSATKDASAGAVSPTTAVDVNTTANGIVLGCAYNGSNPGASNYISWTGLTEQSEIDVGGDVSNTFSTAYASNVTAQTPRSISATIATASDVAARVAASFPAVGGGGLSIPVAIHNMRQQGIL